MAITQTTKSAVAAASSTVVNQAWPGGAPAANSLMVAVGGLASSNTITPGGSGWTGITAVNGTTAQVAIFYKIAPASGEPGSFNMSWTGVFQAYMQLLVYAGNATTSFTDGSKSGTSTAAASVSSGFINTTNGGLIIGGLFKTGSDTLLNTWKSGFSQQGVSGTRFEVTHRLTGSGASYSTAETFDSGNDNSVLLLAGFQQSGAAVMWSEPKQIAIRQAMPRAAFR